MLRRSFVPPSDNSYFLFGPRGTGKSTFVNQFHKNGLFFDLLEPETFNKLVSNPGQMSREIPEGFNDWIVIDEIQKIPALLDEVHRLIEKRGLNFVLTGSSARSLRRKGVNLLAGRAFTLKMYPFTAVELGDEFDLERSLKYGHLPGAFQSSDPAMFLKSYVQTYLAEEIRQEGLTRNLPAFGRFLQTASFSQGAPLNLSAVARDSAVHRKVVENYFSILRDTLLSFEIPVFRRRAKRDLVGSVKFYFFDAGIFRTTRQIGGEASPQMEGAALETLVLQEITAHNGYKNLKYGIFYWRTSRGVEVDFILDGERGFKAIEVKNSGRIRREDFKGLRQFKKDYPEADLFFIYTGTRKYHDAGIEIIPAEEFLKQIGRFI